MKNQNFCHSAHYIPQSAGFTFGSMIRWFGHQNVTDDSYIYNGMKRGSKELVFWQYTISGEGAVDFGGKTYPVKPGEAFLLTVPEKHIYYLPRNSAGWEFLYLGLEGSECYRITRYLREQLPPVSAAYASAETVELAWEIIRRGMENDFKGDQDVSGMTYRFMMSLISGSYSSGDPVGDNMLRKIHHYCIHHLAENISVENMADFAGYSRSHFCRIFPELSGGKNPHEYLLELRVRMATRMLQNSNMPIKEIANRCGFAEIGYFGKVFRRFTGTTPGCFRKQGS